MPDAPSGTVPEGFEPVSGLGAFVDLVGPLHARADEGETVLGLRIDERHLNAAGSVHGGLLATVTDFALGRAVYEGAADDDARPATVSLTTDYLGPAKAGEWLEARTAVEHLGGTLAFADCSLTADGRQVVRGRAVFAVLD